MDFFDQWFQGFGEGLDQLSREERGRLFQPCAALCAKDALKYLYRDLFTTCEGDLDRFFSRLHEVENVDGKVIEAGKIYELNFLACNCDLHTRAQINTPGLCECSRQSILCELKELMPTQVFTVEEVETILNGAARCCFRITMQEEIQR